MRPTDAIGFAAQALWMHRLRTTLTLLGVAVGVVAVVTLTALGEGARRYVLRQFGFLGANVVVVLPGKTETTGAVPGFGGVPHDLTLEDARTLRRLLPQAAHVAPVSMGTETVAARGRSRQVAVVGTTRAFQAIHRLRLRAGRFLPAELDRRGGVWVVLGHTVAQELFPGENAVGQTVRIGGWRFRVIGVLAQRGSQFGFRMDEVVFVPVDRGLRMFNKRSLFRIFLEARAHAWVPYLKRRAREILAARHGEEDVTVITPEAVLRALQDILVALSLALSAIAAISLAVAGVGIMNVMLVTVSERTREVGLCRALGAGRGDVLLLFLTEAVLIAASGGGLGLLGALLLLAVGRTAVPELEAHPPSWAVASALGVALLTGTLFGVLPALRASRLDPVLALRGEG